MRNRMLLLAVFVFCGAGSLPIRAQIVTRGPYLQRGTTTNMVVRWRTSFATSSFVRFGTNHLALDQVASQTDPAIEHEVTVNGLEPDTQYFYSIGTSGFTLAGGDTNHFFTTSPLPGSVKPIRVWVIGDAGTANANQRAVRDAYYDFADSRRADVWLMLGDNAYINGTDAEYQAGMFNVYGSLLRNTVAWSTLGNHETYSTLSNSYPYFFIFTLPKNGEAGGVASGTEYYYSFDYANIHFICLDSMISSRATNGAMADWLRADLASTTSPWIIAFWHHPPYSKGSHDSDSELELIEMRANFLPILESGGVDLVLAGHSHSYERSFLLNGHYGNSQTLAPEMILNHSSGREDQDQNSAYIKSPSLLSHQGAVYAVIGSSGQTSGGSLDHPAMYLSLDELGSFVLDIDGNRLDAKFLRETGIVQDQFTILKVDPELSNPRSASGEAFELTLSNLASGKSHLLQASTNFSDWITLSTNIVSTNSLQVIDPDAPDHATRFYRILRLP